MFRHMMVNVFGECAPNRGSDLRAESVQVSTSDVELRRICSCWHQTTSCSHIVHAHRWLMKSTKVQTLGKLRMRGTAN